MKLGDKGADVKALQAKLNIPADGIFGSHTESVVKKFQKEHNLVVDGVVGPKTLELLGLSAKSSDLFYKKSKRRIDKIILHCSATPEGKAYTVADIKKWHTLPVSKGGRGWSDIGYHYIILLNGEIALGRDVDLAGAHTQNHNANSIGVCYIGGVASDGKTPKDTRTPEQKQAFKVLLEKLHTLYPNATIHGHYEFAKKACPSFNVNEYK